MSLLDKTPTTDETIVVDCELAEPPHQVWRALTEPDLLAAWLMPNDIQPEVGRRFSFRDEAGAVECQVLDVEPNRSLTYSWRDEREPGGKALDSTVTWTLTPTFIGGTHLRLVHDGFALTTRGSAVMAIGRIAGALRRRPRLIRQSCGFRLAA
jgi:uncharacterized protein YndB with AHSA1/START domain